MESASSLGTKLVGLGRSWMIEASAIAMRHYDSFSADSGVMTKDDSSPLTLADIEIDAFVGRVLNEHFHGIPAVTEERAASHQLEVGDGPFFLVDPLDGTKEFINKRDEFTVNIALLQNRQPVAGLVCAPALGKTYFGVVGTGARLLDMATGEERQLSVADADETALRVVASRSHLTDETRTFIEAHPVSATRNAGSSLKFCLLASGEADLYPRFGPTMEWDTAAGHAVLLAAGGFVHAMDGAPLGYAKPGFRNGWFIAGAGSVRYEVPRELLERA